MQGTITDVEQELTRIRTEYDRRNIAPELRGRYSIFKTSTLALLQELERELLTLLQQHSFTQLADKKILDIGCGAGNHLQRFLTYGAHPSNLAGIDLMPAYIAQARALNPLIDWRVGSAHQLPYPAASFDLVTLFVVFSSILNQPLRQQIAREALRVLQPGGLILCYDFVYPNPHNPAVQAIPRREIQQLFHHEGAHFTFRRVTLAPPFPAASHPIAACW